MTIRQSRFISVKVRCCVIDTVVSWPLAHQSHGFSFVPSWTPSSEDPCSEKRFLSGEGR